MVTILLIMMLLSLLIYHFYFRNKRAYELMSKIPGPPPLPLIGNILMFNVDAEKLWEVLRDLNKKYYPIAKMWLGPYPVISIHHPDDLEILLSSTKHLEKGFAYKCLHPWLKTGLVTSDGGKWQHRRKILTPAFHFKILRKYVDITNENGKSFIEALRTDNKETVQNLLPFSSNYTLNIICESAMGIALDKIDKTAATAYKKAVYDMGNIVIYRAVRPYLLDWMISPLSKMSRVQKQALKILHQFSNQVMVERKEYHKNSDYKYLKDLDDDTEEIDTEDIAIGRKKKLAMLDLLLAAEKDGLIEDEGIQEEVDTFMFAGHDTTGMSLVFNIMLLAENEEVQDKVRAEVTRVLNKSMGEIGMSELQEFNYLERCIKEALRLYPPVPAISRYLSEEIKLKDYVIPAGAEIGCHIFDLHRDPNFWTDPDKYDPDRFLPERIQGRHPYSYVPFSAGSRNCIGQKFALMELKSLIARILYNFKLEPVTRISDMKLVLDLVTRPSKPVYTKFVRIDNNNQFVKSRNVVQ